MIPRRLRASPANQPGHTKKTLTSRHASAPDNGGARPLSLCFPPDLPRHLNFPSPQFCLPVTLAAGQAPRPPGSGRRVCSTGGDSDWARALRTSASLTHFTGSSVCWGRFSTLSSYHCPDDLLSSKVTLRAFERWLQGELIQIRALGLGSPRLRCTADQIWT